MGAQIGIELPRDHLRPTAAAAAAAGCCTMNRCRHCCWQASLLDPEEARTNPPSFGTADTGEEEDGDGGARISAEKKRWSAGISAGKEKGIDSRAPNFAVLFWTIPTYVRTYVRIYMNIYVHIRKNVRIVNF